MMLINVKKEFEEWAKGLAGCDGGNPDGSIWFCGIEWGGGDDVEQVSFNKIDKPVWDDDRLKEFSKYQYDRKVAKIYSTLLGRDIGEYKEVAFDKRLFSSHSDLFKLNLYPISFHHDADELWDQRWYERTGLPTKSIYRAWCQINRFKTFQDLVVKHSPKLIIATGSSYKTDFIMAFESAEAIYCPDIKEVVLPEKRKMFWLEINKGQTILAIIPFLGTRYGLNSDGLLRDASKKIEEICTNQLGSDWLKINGVRAD